jgi:homoserine O-succinyltransferase
MSFIKDEEPLRIALVNNMPDCALHTTERQFRRLLSDSFNSQRVLVDVYSLPEVARSGEALRYAKEHHRPLSELWNAEVDGLVVTGTQPSVRDLSDEPYWRSLELLIDWAEDSTIASVWSCLAAHAAVFRLDGIERQSFSQKLSGVFTCATSKTHPLAEAFPDEWPVPHSRYYNLPSRALTDAGYSILSSSSEVGADLFVKERRSLFLMCQGHPEYDPCSLMREFRADVGRFLANERLTYPDMPRNYFDESTAVELDRYRGSVESQVVRSRALAAPLFERQFDVAHRWDGTARTLYRSWLAYLQKHKRARRSEPVVSEESQRV